MKMYLKILSGLTAAFLAILFVIMVQTVPSATVLHGDYANLSVIKVNCIKTTLQGDPALKHI